MQERHWLRYLVKSPNAPYSRARRSPGPQFGTLIWPTRGSPLVNASMTIHHVMVWPFWSTFYPLLASKSSVYRGNRPMGVSSMFQPKSEHSGGRLMLVNIKLSHLHRIKFLNSRTYSIGCSTTQYPTPNWYGFPNILLSIGFQTRTIFAHLPLSLSVFQSHIARPILPLKWKTLSLGGCSTPAFDPTCAPFCHDSLIGMSPGDLPA